MNTLTFLVTLRDETGCCPFNNRQGLATNSDLRRWINEGSITFNGERLQWNDEVQFPLTDLVFFPKSAKKRITLGCGT